MHQTFRRPLEAETVRVQPVLPSPPRREWLELASFWKAGNTGPVWFLADPRRTDLALIDPRSRTDVTAIRWAPVVAPGVRRHASRGRGLGAHAGAALVRRGRLGAHARDRRHGPADGAWPAPGADRRARPPRSRRSCAVLIGGRNLAAPGRSGRPLHDGHRRAHGGHWDAAPGFFLRTTMLPAGALAGDGPLAELTVRSTAVTGDAVIPTAIEQFDLQMPGHADVGLRCRLARGGVHTGGGACGTGPATDRRCASTGATTDVRVTLGFESPRRYFDAPITLRASAGDAEIASSSVDASRVVVVRRADRSPARDRRRDHDRDLARPSCPPSAEARPIVVDWDCACSLDASG